MQQDHKSARPLDQGADSRPVARADDQIPFPVPGHGAVGGLGRPLVDLDTLQAALNHAVERLNMARFTPVGQARDLAVTTLRLAVEAIAEGNTTLAAAILEQVQPDSPDNTTATVAGCIACPTGGTAPRPARLYRRRVKRLVCSVGGDCAADRYGLGHESAIEEWPDHPRGLQ